MFDRIENFSVNKQLDNSKKRISSKVKYYNFEITG